MVPPNWSKVHWPDTVSVRGPDPVWMGTQDGGATTRTTGSGCTHGDVEPR